MVGLRSPKAAGGASLQKCPGPLRLHVWAMFRLELGRSDSSRWQGSPAMMAVDQSRLCPENVFAAVCTVSDAANLLAVE